YATSGSEGISRALASPPEIILLDVVLPDMKGHDVCKKLSKDDRTAKCLIVLMTAKDEGIRDQFKGFSQVVGFLHKPFSATDLVTRLNEASAMVGARG